MTDKLGTITFGYARAPRCDALRTEHWMNENDRCSLREHKIGPHVAADGSTWSEAEVKGRAISVHVSLSAEGGSRLIARSGGPVPNAVKIYCN